MILVTPIKLYPDAEYRQTVTLEQFSFQMRFYINTRTQLYHFDITDALDNPIILGVCLLPYTKLCEQPDLSPYGLTGYFVMMPLNANTVFEEVVPEALFENYGLLYLSEPVE